mgnify:CR=1 FL=1
MYELGGNATSKQIFARISHEDKEKFKFDEPTTVGKWINLKKGLYITRKYKRYGKIFEQTYQLKPRVIKYFDELENAGKEQLDSTIER